MKWVFSQVLLLVVVISVEECRNIALACEDAVCAPNESQSRAVNSPSQRRAARAVKPFGNNNPASRREHYEYRHQQPIPVPVPIYYQSKGHVVLPTIPKPYYNTQGYSNQHRISNRQFVQYPSLAQHTNSHTQRITPCPPGSYCPRPPYPGEVRQQGSGHTFGPLPQQGSATKHVPFSSAHQLLAPIATYNQYSNPVSYKQNQVYQNYHQRERQPLESPFLYDSHSQRQQQPYNVGKVAVDSSSQSAKHQISKPVEYGGWIPVPGYGKKQAHLTGNEIRPEHPFRSIVNTLKPVREEQDYSSQAKQPHADYDSHVKKIKTKSPNAGYNYGDVFDENEGFRQSEEYGSDNHFEEPQYVPIVNVAHGTAKHNFDDLDYKESFQAEQRYKKNLPQETPLRVGKLPGIPGDRLIYPDYAKRKSFDNLKNKQPIRFANIRESKASADYL